MRASEFLNEAELDPTGWGATPQGTDVDYFGLKVKMRPSTFLKLSHPLNTGEQNPDIEKYMQGGGKIAYPFLEIKDPVEWEDGDFSQVGKVVNHEGRNRMTHWIKMKGDEPIQVNVFLRGANRRRYVTDDMIQALSQGLISQTGQLVRNPFDANTALEEASVQGNRWTGPEQYRHLVELDLEEGWKEKAAAGALALGALGAHGDAEAKYKETWIQPRQQAAHATMAPAAKFDSTQIKAKAPIAKAPIAKSPIAKAPIAKAPIAKAPIAKAPVGSTNVDPTAMNILSLHNPEAEEVLHRTAKAAGLKGTELAQFMAQTRHESADFSRMKEMGGDKYFNKLYDPKTSPRTAKILGNTKIGDGIRYHGRGFIQITGRDNYRMAGEALNLPLEKHPELASKPAIAAKIAIWYWKTRVKPGITNFADTAAVTKKINPAMRGLQDRHEYFKDYKNII